MWGVETCTRVIAMALIAAVLAGITVGIRAGGGLIAARMAPADLPARRVHRAARWTGGGAMHPEGGASSVNAVATVATGGYAGLQLLDSWVQGLRRAGGYRGVIYVLTDRPELIVQERFPGGGVVGIGVRLDDYFPAVQPDYAPNVLKSDLLALLPARAERILFLDLDIIVSNSLEPVERQISSLYEPGSGAFPHSLAAWTDVICRGLVSYFDPDACMSGSYINAGAFFVDRGASGDCMARWKEAMVGRDGWAALIDTLPRNEMKCPAFAACGRDDQYALNHLLRSGVCGSWALLSPHYNWGMNSWIILRALQKLKLPKKTLSHFTSSARAKLREVPTYRRSMARWLREVGIDRFFNTEGDLIQAQFFQVSERKRHVQGRLDAAAEETV